MTFTLRYWLYLLGGIVVLAIAAAVWAHLARDARTERRLATITEQAATVVLRTRDASDNPKLTWALVPGQIVALGEANKRLKGAIAEQNATIDQWAREAAERRAEASEWKRIADKAQAQRQSALKRLSRDAVTPGTRDDCMTLLQEAETALDLARENGA